MSSERENQSHLMCPEDTDPMNPPKIISMSAAQIAMIVTMSAPTIIPRLRRISGVVTNQSRYLLGVQVCKNLDRQSRCTPSNLLSTAISTQLMTRLGA